MKSKTPVYTRVGDHTLKVDGNIKAESNICVSGQIKGNITVDNEVLLNEDCTVTGDVAGSIVTVEGTVIGNIKSNKCFIRSTGKVTGNVATDVIVVDEGGSFCGNCSMKSAQRVEPKKEVSATASTPTLTSL